MPCAMQKGASHTSVTPQPSRVTPTTAGVMYRSGKISSSMSSSTHASIRATKYHMGPQEKNCCPK